MGIFNCRMTRGGSNYSLHAEGRALDWHLDIHSRADREQAQQIITMLLGADGKDRKAALDRPQLARARGRTSFWRQQRERPTPPVLTDPWG